MPSKVHLVIRGSNILYLVHFSFSIMIPITRPLLLLVIVILLLYFRQDTQNKIAKAMPLVVPGLQSKGGDDQTNKWMNDLVGKKLGEHSDEIVCVT